LEPISEKLKGLEDNINKVGNTTVQIGNNLETIDSHKKRAIEADKLIRYINEFNKYETNNFKDVMLPLKHKDKTGNEQIAYTIFTKVSRKGAAKKIKQLNLIVKDLGKIQSCYRVRN
jgi:biotin-(acetyl-CoA carboxylase) ligase